MRYRLKFDEKDILAEPSFNTSAVLSEQDIAVGWRNARESGPMRDDDTRPISAIPSGFALE